MPNTPTPSARARAVVHPGPPGPLRIEHVPARHARSLRLSLAPGLTLQQALLDARQAASATRKQLQTIDTALPFVNVTTIEENISQGLWAPRTGAALLGAFGLLLVFFTHELAYFFGARFWYLVWLLLFLIQSIRLAKFLLVDLQEKKASHDAKARIDKWLPQPKK